ncbi:hypothetical protein J6590_071782 [Homalodisca vitripennis]|nr:hypothetical protein J6590_071782 [Homalodisca vitripennis]
MDVNDMWFHQDGATCHTAKDSMNILHERFGSMVISRRGFVRKVIGLIFFRRDCTSERVRTDWIR